jgi:hypothetical protein
MKTFTYNDMKSWGPCYDPNKYLPVDWKGTALDIINYPCECNAHDRAWIIIRSESLDVHQMDEFINWVSSRGKEAFPDLKDGKAKYHEYLEAFENTTELLDKLKEILTRGK